MHFFKTISRRLIAHGVVGALFAAATSTQAVQADESAAFRTNLKTNVAALCTLSFQAESLDLGDITTGAAAYAVPLKLMCNGPFSSRVASRNGGLKHITAEATDEFGNLLVYDLALSALDASGAPAAHCSSQAVQADTCQVGIANGGPAKAKALLQLTLGEGGSSLIAGQYEDEIILTIEART